LFITGKTNTNFDIHFPLLIINLQTESRDILDTFEKIKYLKKRRDLQNLRIFMITDKLLEFLNFKGDKDKFLNFLAADEKFLEI